MASVAKEMVNCPGSENNHTKILKEMYRQPFGGICILLCQTRKMTA